MSLIRRTSPFGELLSLRQAMDRLFEDSYVRPRGAAYGDEPEMPLDLRATKDELIIQAALPGYKPEDVEVTLTGNQLTLTARTESDEQSEQEGWLHREIRRGSVSRTLTLPSDVDAEKAAASFENGMLRLAIPKAEQAKPRQIRIGGSSGTDDGTQTRRVEAGTAAGGSGSNA